MSWSLRKALGLDYDKDTGGRPATEGEMAPGVPRPTYVLAGLIATSILKNPHSVKKREKWYRHDSASWEIRWEHKNSVILYQWKVRIFTTNGKNGIPQEVLTSVTWDGRNITHIFKQSDLKQIIEALHSSANLKQKLDENKEESLKQEIACDLIEKFTLGEVPNE